MGLCQHGIKTTIIYFTVLIYIRMKLLLNNAQFNIIAYSFKVLIKN